MADFDGKSSGQRILTAFDCARSIDDIVVVAPPDVSLNAHKQFIRYSSGTFVDNVQIGLRHYAAADTVMIALSDIPFLRASSVDWLAEQADSHPSAAFLFPAVDKATTQRFLPYYRRPLHQMREYHWKEGNVFVVRPAKIARMEELFDDCFTWRDYTAHPFENIRLSQKYSGVGGIFFAAAWLLGYHLARTTGSSYGLSRYLTQERFEQYLGKALGGPLKMVRSTHADFYLEFDMHQNDAVDEYTILRTHFKRFSRIIEAT